MKMPTMKRKILRYLHEHEDTDYLDIAAAFPSGTTTDKKLIYKAGVLLEQEKYVVADDTEQGKYRITPEGNKHIVNERRARISIVVVVLTLLTAIVGFSLRDVLFPSDLANVGEKASSNQSAQANEPIGSDFVVELSSEKTSLEVTEQILITAHTSTPAQSVSLYSTTDLSEYGPEPMKTSNAKSWSFKAEFFEPGTHTLRVVALDKDGNVAEDSITLQIYESSLPVSIEDVLSMLDPG